MGSPHGHVEGLSVVVSPSKFSPLMEIEDDGEEEAAEVLNEVVEEVEEGEVIEERGVQLIPSRGKRSRVANVHKKCILRHNATELRLKMRGDGFLKVEDLLKLDLETAAKFQLKSQERSVSLIFIVSHVHLICCNGSLCTWYLREEFGIDLGIWLKAYE
ncbi:hypothetical protein YC2023_017406 [Brassica napus]